MKRIFLVVCILVILVPGVANAGLGFWVRKIPLIGFMFYGIDIVEARERVCDDYMPAEECARLIAAEIGRQEVEDWENLVNALAEALESQDD
jgi:hypothetical protein